MALASFRGESAACPQPTQGPVKPSLVDVQLVNRVRFLRTWSKRIFFVRIVCTRKHSSRMKRRLFSDSGGGVPPDTPPTETPLDRQTPVKTLPCPKLRLRTVKMSPLCGDTATNNYGVKWVSIDINNSGPTRRAFHCFKIRQDGQRVSGYLWPKNA